MPQTHCSTTKPSSTSRTRGKAYAHHLIQSGCPRERQRVRPHGSLQLGASCTAHAAVNPRACPPPRGSPGGGRSSTPSGRRACCWRPPLAPDCPSIQHPLPMLCTSPTPNAAHRALHCAQLQLAPAASLPPHPSRTRQARVAAVRCRHRRLPVGRVPLHVLHQRAQRGAERNHVLRHQLRPAGLRRWVLHACMRVPTHRHADVPRLWTALGAHRGRPSGAVPMCHGAVLCERVLCWSLAGPHVATAVRAVQGSALHVRRGPPAGASGTSPPRLPSAPTPAAGDYGAAMQWFHPPFHSTSIIIWMRISRCTLAPSHSHPRRRVRPHADGGRHRAVPVAHGAAVRPAQLLWVVLQDHPAVHGTFWTRIAPLVWAVLLRCSSEPRPTACTHDVPDSTFRR